MNRDDMISLWGILQAIATDEMDAIVRETSRLNGLRDQCRLSLGLQRGVTGEELDGWLAGRAGR